MKQLRTSLVIMLACLVVAGCGAGTSNSGESVTPDDPEYPQQWALPAIGAPRAWASSTGSRAVQVAVIDSGSARVPDLDPNLAAGVRCSPNCSAEGGPDVTGHGTSVASILGAAGNNKLDMSGVAWNVSLVPVQAVDDQGALSVPAVASGISWAASKHIPIVNVSLTMGGQDEAISAAIGAAPQTLFVVPAGNDGLDIDQRRTPIYPCVDERPNIICVAGSERDGSISDRSNRGATSVDIAAPGADILAEGRQGQSVYVNGTSFAAPMVAGAAALLLSANPAATPMQLKAALMCGAERAAATGEKVASGGLNVAAAMRVLASLDGEPSGSPTCGS